MPDENRRNFLKATGTGVADSQSGWTSIAGTSSSVRRRHRVWASNEVGNCASGPAIGGDHRPSSEYD